VSKKGWTYSHEDLGNWAEARSLMQGVTATVAGGATFGAAVAGPLGALVGAVAGMAVAALVVQAHRDDRVE